MFLMMIMLMVVFFSPEVKMGMVMFLVPDQITYCLLYTSDAADDLLCVDLGG